MIEVQVIECVPGDPRHQVVLNVNGVFFWLQAPCSDKATAEEIARQVKTDISTQVARIKESSPKEPVSGGNG